MPVMRQISLAEQKPLKSSILSGERKDIQVKKSVSGALLTTMGVGGPLNTLVTVDSIQALCKIVFELQSDSQQLSVLGAGSNLLINDNGLKSPVLKLGKGFSGLIPLEDTSLDICDLEELRVRSLGGKNSANICLNNQQYLIFGSASTMRLSASFSSQGLSGLEFAAGIPASFGGAIAMNAGAHGSQISDILRRVIVIDTLGRLQVLDAEVLEFAYRSVQLPLGSVIIGGVVELERVDPAVSSKQRARCLEYRKRTQPLTLPSAGSVFRNPDEIELSAGALIEIAGLNFLQHGGVSFSDLHKNWIVRNNKYATASSVKALITEAQRAVKLKFGVRLETEVVEW